MPSWRTTVKSPSAAVAAPTLIACANAGAPAVPPTSHINPKPIPSNHFPAQALLLRSLIFMTSSVSLPNWPRSTFRTVFLHSRTRSCLLFRDDDTDRLLADVKFLDHLTGPCINHLEIVRPTVPDVKACSHRICPDAVRTRADIDL